MSIGEGVQARLAYKKYASGVIIENELADSDADLGATGAQVLRRLQSTLDLKSTFNPSQEVREDQQVVDSRKGSNWVEGSISGEWSPETYADLFEASFRGTWAASVTGSETDFTSVTLNSAGTITFAAGDPVAKGFRVGYPVQFANLATAGNNGVNFTILAFGGTSNRTLTVFPAPITETADTAFTVTQKGKSLILPSRQADNVNRKFGFEHYHPDVSGGLYKLFTECRVGGFKLNMPAEGNCTIEHMVRGRFMETGTGGPFFTDPDPETDTGIFNSVNGLLRVHGSAAAVVTGITLNMDRKLTGTACQGQNFFPAIHVQKAEVGGQITMQLTGGTTFDDFKNETEIDLLSQLVTGSASNADSNIIYCPRIKLGSAINPLQGEAAQIVTADFTALKYVGSGAGIPQTTIQICDTTL
ncbi:phage tail tube protein [Bradyrhizobium sp. PMVTL-01]|uniref:phage tail tube protein n=1 Tax=Bradyrhizobium sp. PMVTL-01 TaxID=3434999 RepID=UPI003F72D0AD